MYRFVSRRLPFAVFTAVVAAVALLTWYTPARTAGNLIPDDAAVERTRDNAHMLDDLYKGFVVHITATYVKAQERTPAATVAKKVFKHMEDKGWGSGRLIDATGTPVNRKNVAQSDFEKRAVTELKAGKTYYDEVGTKNGKPVLRAATAVLVVMKECIACHSDHKEGDLLGALVYELPIK
jgi:hypothetical protein